MEKEKFGMELSNCCNGGQRNKTAFVTENTRLYLELTLGGYDCLWNKLNFYFVYLSGIRIFLRYKSSFKR